MRPTRRMLTPGTCRGEPLFAILVIVLLISGCANEGPVPSCRNCEDWALAVPGLSRYPEPHPTETEFLAFSTVEKQPGLDQSRESDEDLWLAWRGSGGDRRYQLTGDVPAGGDSALAVGDNLGDNFSPRWSPSGTQVAFMHSTRGGIFEIWRMAVTLPGAPTELPVLGNPVLVAANARDPAWQSETSLFFTRNKKLYQIDVPAAPDQQPSSPAVQVSFDPPPYSTNEKFVDRHPSFPHDSGMDNVVVFDTQGRRSTASLFVGAFEVDARSCSPPCTTVSNAWISFQAPDASIPSYPILDQGDTLQTPTLLNSLAVDAGGAFRLGVRRDFRFLPPADSAETYCDTTLTKVIDLQPGDADTLTFVFEIARGTLRIGSGISNTRVFWTRQDGRVTSDNFLSNTIQNPGSFLNYGCLLSYKVTPGGAVDPSALETYLVRGTRGTKQHDVVVTVPPDSVVTVSLFPTGSISGTMSFTDNPVVLPQVQITVFQAGTSEVCGGAFSNVTTGSFVASRIPGDQDGPGTYDLLFEVADYDDVQISGVVVQPPNNTPIGTVSMSPSGPGTREIPKVSPPPARAEPAAGAGDASITSAFRLVSREVDNPQSLRALLRAPGDRSAVWTLDLTDPDRPSFREVLGSRDGLVQHPAVTADQGNGLRYVAYISNERGDWELYVQRLNNWVADGRPVRVETPGTLDNFSCTRNVFQPRWVPGRLSLLVALTDCPDNGFEDIDLDADPWALGELRIWEVEVGPR